MTDVLKIDSEWMQLALEQAAIAASKGEVPVGAVIVSQNKIIGSGFNAPITLNDPTAHAEVQALRDARALYHVRGRFGACTCFKSRIWCDRAESGLSYKCS